MVGRSANSALPLPAKLCVEISTSPGDTDVAQLPGSLTPGRLSSLYVPKPNDTASSAQWYDPSELISLPHMCYLQESCRTSDRPISAASACLRLECPTNFVQSEVRELVSEELWIG